MDPIKELIKQAYSCGITRDIYVLAEIAVQLKRIADNMSQVVPSTSVPYTYVPSTSVPNVCLTPVTTYSINNS